MSNGSVSEDWLGRLMGVRAPWRVVGASAPEGDVEGFVEIEVGHGGGPLACPECGEPAKRHDARRREWRDLDLHRRKTKVVADVPRAKCPEHGVLSVPVPWADKGSRFTALFEADAIERMRGCSLSAAAKQMGVSWDQASAIQSRAVERGEARRAAQFPTRIGVDETSFRKRHNYVTVLNDLDGGAVLGVAQGRTKAALDGLFAEFDAAARMGVEVVAMDMHEPYIRSVRENTLAAVAFDKFHVAQALSRGIDQVRRREHRTHGADAAPLKRTRFLWLRSAKSLEDEQRARLDGLRRQYGDLGRAWGIKEWAMSLWTGRERAEVEGRWREWLARAQRSRLKPMVKVARTVRNHLQGIVTAVCTGVTNARAESVNAKIQWIKRMAHGYRNIQRFMRAILFHLGQLDMRPHAHAIPH